MEYKVTFLAHLSLRIEILPTTNKDKHTQCMCILYYIGTT